MDYTDSKIDRLIVNKLTREQYKTLSSQSLLCSDQLYSINDLPIDAADLKILNVATPTTSSDAANKNYVDSNLSNYYDKSTIDTTFQKYTVVNKLTQAEYDILSATGQLNEDELYIITDSKTTDEIIKSNLSSYYKKTETSSAAQISTALNGKQAAGSYATTASLTAYETKSDLTSNYYKKTETSSASQIQNAIDDRTTTYMDDVSSDISVNNVTESEMAAILESGNDIPNSQIYLVSSDTENMFGQRVTNVGTPTANTDAATKAYVDQQISTLKTLLRNAGVSI